MNFKGGGSIDINDKKCNNLSKKEDKREKMEKRLEMYYQLSDHYICRKIVGETILVPVGEKALEFTGLAAMNETAAFLWEQLKVKRTKDELCDALRAEYDVSEEEAYRDIEEFLGLALEREMIFCREEEENEKS